MNGNFYEELTASGLIHRPLADIGENNLEQYRKKEKVLDRKALRVQNDKEVLFHTGQGSLTVTEGEQAFFTLEGKNITYCWPPEMSQDGDFAFYGTVGGHLKIAGENWEQYHRLRFQVRPRCDGSRILNMAVTLRNDGAVKVPEL